MCVCVCACVVYYGNVQVPLCMCWILPSARCGMIPDMSRDAELHSCWAVNRDPYNPVLLSQHDKPLGIHCKISGKKNPPCQPTAANPASHIFFNIFSLNNIFLESKSWYHAKKRSESDKREKGNLATQQFSLYQETSCREINGPSLKAVLWITTGSNKENNTLTGMTKPWPTPQWSSLL